MNLCDFPDVGRVADVAAAMHCDVKTVYGLIDRGELDAIRLGVSIRVTKQALLRFLGVALIAFLGISDAETSGAPELRIVEGGGG